MGPLQRICGSAALGEWIPKEKFLDTQRLRFHLDINGQTVQEGCTTDMLYKVDEIISYISRYFTLKTGDIIYTAAHQVVDLYISMTIWKDT